MNEKTIITEEYFFDKECKHSWCMKPERTSSTLKGMTIYLPKILSPKKPKSVKLTLELRND